jgi:hypothetical protein
MNPYKVGDRIRAQRSIGAPHEPAEVVATPVHVTPKTLDGRGGERIQQVAVRFEDGQELTLVAESPAVAPA